MANMDASFLSAAANGDISKVEQLVQKGISINTQGEMNRTALHLASLYGRVDVVIYLIDKGVDLNIKASGGEVPLHLAVLNGHTSIVEYLLGEGCDWKIQNNMGKRPGDYARKKEMKKLFDDAEKGVFNADTNEDPSKVIIKKHKGLQVNEKIMNELIKAGYGRPAILDALYALHERCEDTNSIGLVMKELIIIEEKQKKTETKETDKKDDNDDNVCKICF